MRSTRFMPLPGLFCVLAALPLAAEAETAARHRCAAALQGKVAWNQAGDKRWSAAKIARLCQGAENSAEPARCFEKVMHGGVDWGGGTRWQWQNALDLCSGAKNAGARISCFRKKVAADTGWRQAIRQCAGTGALTLPGALRKRLQPDVGKLGKPPSGQSSPLDKKSGSVRFGDGEHGRRPPSGSADTDAKIRQGAGPSGNLSGGSGSARVPGASGQDALSPGMDKRRRLRLKPRVTGYRPSTVMQGGEVTVQGTMLGNSKDGRRLVLGLNANPDHSLARNLTARRWTPGKIVTRVPENVLPAKYFIAVMGAGGKWLTNRLRTLRVLGRQKVTVRAVVELRCYADVLQRPNQLQVTLKPVRPGDLGMEPGQTISVRLPFKEVSPGKFGRRYYAYAAATDIPQGLFEARMKRPEGAAYFKVRDWSRAQDAAAYYASKPCAARRRVHHETGKPLKDPPVYVFKFPPRARTVRIGRRTPTLELRSLALADPAELGALPEPTPVGE